MRRDLGTILRGTANWLQRKLLLRVAKFTAKGFQTIPMAPSTHFPIWAFAGHDPDCWCKELLLEWHRIV